MRARRPLVGRSEELGTLAGLLDRAAPGGRALAVGGEAGIGKTRLLEEAAALAQRHGRRVHAGQAAELDRDTPFAPFVDALQHLDDVERSRVAALRAEQRDLLATVFPALADLGEPRVEGLHRYHSHHAIRRLLEELGRRAPRALLLDDLHWADQASLELVAHLLRRPPEAPLVLVLAFRPAELSRPVHTALDHAEREGRLARLGLAPLSRAQADELIGDEVSRETRGALFRESGGNPLYLEELLAAHGRAGGGADPRLPDVPAAVRRALAGELEALAPEARLVARAGAVLGEVFAPDLVAAVAGLDGGATAHALDAVVDADLARPARPPLLRFRHPVVRRAIYEDAPPAWRAEAHARADAALAAQGASAVQRAVHVERSAAPGDRDAIDVLVAAGRVGARHAPAIAARWFDAARRLLPPDRAEDELPLLLLLGVCLGLGGELERSRAVLGEALTHLQRLPRARVGRRLRRRRRPLPRSPRRRPRAARGDAA